MQLAVCTPNISQLDLDGSTSCVRSVVCGTPFLSKLHFIGSDWTIRFSFRVIACARMHATCSVQTVHRAYHFIAWIVWPNIYWSEPMMAPVHAPWATNRVEELSNDFPKEVIQGWRLIQVVTKIFVVILQNLMYSLL